MAAGTGRVCHSTPSATAASGPGPDHYVDPVGTGGFLAALDERDGAALVALGTPRAYRAGAALILEGDESKHVFVLLEGSVKVASTAPDGRELLLAVRGAGEVIGELSALEGGHSARSASVLALELVRARSIPGQEFLDYLAAHPQAMLLLVRGLIGRLRDADRRRVEFGSFDTLHRVARLLAELAEATGRPAADGVELGIPLSQEELAGMVSASRESVTRALTTLRRLGLVTTGRKSVVVNDIAALRAFGP